MANWFIYNKRENYINNSKIEGITKLDALILGNRDIVDPKLVDMYINPSLNKLHNPYDLPDMTEAIDIIIETIQENGEIRIFGDYDQDGIASVMTLLDGLLFYYDNISYDIPHRVDEGYGISSGMSDKAIEDKVSLVITCDNGITGFDQVKKLKENGIKVIVTDHHQIEKEDKDGWVDQILPDADCVINPHRLDSKYPFKDLCGAGVSFKLMQALYMKLDGDFEYLASLLEYVAMGTVCDIVSLTDENRIFVIEGLKRLNITEKYAIKVLLEEAGWNKQIDEYTLGFIIGPLMNATGRLSTAKLAIELLIEEDMDRIRQLAKELVELNNTRKNLTQEGLDKCDKLVKDNSFDKSDVIVVYEPSIDESICGIVAGRIKEKYYRPTIVLTKSAEDGILKGSGRSIETYNMHKAILPFEDNLESFGGHPMACGLSIKDDMVDDFRHFLNSQSKLTKNDLEEVINIDTQINISKLSLEFAEKLDKYRPFGKDNPRPVFANKSVDIADIQMIGKDKKTMRINLHQNGRYFNAIKFNAVDDYEYLKLKFNNNIKGNKIDIVYYPDVNEFRGNKNLQLRLIDIR
ncbi:single-stranded-DNA-specific exonuclease RecJ [Anaerococcus prevotii]|uniref:Single-stranded-DNA-specific exonuclease RecJ n=1 Tax=Anaerococcus prevotii ACS-065-V-Col13 TaxID=879305 RepID=F0GU86_9FIRM|nr:single-stranded-DNA-specific exonuclease RecJ [Anaerococcus prevotii]EGC82475.1 single-stranded-DNA-specific exonuclease RecJ [Anaerococcus prevotii ACS-065-V-Col13]